MYAPFYSQTGDRVPRCTFLRCVVGGRICACTSCTTSTSPQTSSSCQRTTTHCSNFTLFLWVLHSTLKTVTDIWEAAIYATWLINGRILKLQRLNLFVPVPDVTQLWDKLLKSSTPDCMESLDAFHAVPRLLCLQLLISMQRFYGIRTTPSSAKTQKTFYIAQTIGSGG
jgi:hypothetical protein